MSFYTAMQLLGGVGIFLYAIKLISESLQMLAGERLRNIIGMFTKTPVLGVFLGTAVTMVIQSSSATTGMTVSFVDAGLMNLTQAIGVIMGANIGTTVTAVLAALGTGRAARQACTAHVLFNVIGVCIWLPLMPLWIGVIEASSSSIGHQIANAHTLFNICNTIIFLPFVRPFAALIRRIIPDAERIDRRDAVYLDPNLIQRTPVVAVSAVRRECRHMGEMVDELLSRTEKVFFGQKDDEKENVLQMEDRLDNLEEAIRSYASDIMQAGIDGKDADMLEACVISAGDLERIGDKGKRLIDFYEYRKKRGDDFSPEALSEVRRLFTDTRKAVKLAINTFGPDPFTAQHKAELDALADHIRDLEAQLRASHASRLSTGHCSPEAGLVFIDVLGAIEQIAYRSRKIADHMAGKKSAEA